MRGIKAEYLLQTLVVLWVLMGSSLSRATTIASYTPPAGNYKNIYTGNGSASGQVEERAFGLTLGTTSYSATSLTLNLALSNLMNSTTFTVNLYSGSSTFTSGVSPLSTLLETFTNPTFTYNSDNLVGDSPTVSPYTLTLATPVVLLAGSSYWIQVTNADTDPANNTVPVEMAAGNTAATVANGGSQIQVNTPTAPGVIYATSSTMASALTGTGVSGVGSYTPEFIFNGTAVAVPEPSTYVLFVLGFLALFTVVRSRQASVRA